MDRRNRLYKSFDNPDDDFSEELPTPSYNYKRFLSHQRCSVTFLVLGFVLLYSSITYIAQHSKVPIQPMVAARFPTKNLTSLLETDKISVASAIVSQESLIEHHTEKYTFNETDALLVLRRGWSFNFNLTIKEADLRGKLHSKSLVQVYLTNVDNPTTFEAQAVILSHRKEHVNKKEQTVLEMAATTPHTAGVNVYNLTLCFYEPESGDTHKEDYPALEDVNCYRVLTGLVLLFNPYSPKDQVYMKDEGHPVLLPEYIENEYGTIWRGSLNDIAPMKWYYAQFDEYVLHSLLYLLKNYTEDTSDPVKISRWMTFSLNAGDTGIPKSNLQSAPSGVLLGRWFGNFSDGIEPEAWMSSQDIFKQYFQTKQTVKYGQCWVYAAIMNTALRGLGIPSRQLVTFNSAHEPPRGVGWFSHVINKYYDVKTGRVLYMDGTIWNFHSWNDAWMKRPDLGHVYDGWQAVDATPQETSHKKYQCGPSPLQAVYEFQDEVDYDASFLISEVSARVRRFTGTCTGVGFARHCTRDEDLGFAPLYQSKVAALMSTPQPGTNGETLSDVSDLYHQPLPPAPANTSAPANTTIPVPPQPDSNTTNTTTPGELFSFPHTPMFLPSFPHLRGQCNVSLRASCDLIGSPIVVSTTFSCPNNTLDHFNISYYINGYFTDYIGRDMLHMNSHNGTLDLNSKSGFKQSVSNAFTFEEYHQKDPIVQQFSFDVFARLEETGQVLVDTDVIDLQDPPILITATSLVTIPKDSTDSDGFKSYPVTFRFSNSLPIPLTNCQLSIQAVNMGLNKKIDIETVPASGGGTVSHKDSFIPTVKSEGKNSILAYLSCNEINGIRGDADVQVILR